MAQPPNHSTLHRGVISHRALLLVAIVAAVASATTDIGSWNDAARLATVESLVDRHTWQMDGSIFFHRTLDRAFIAGHYYSHRSAVPSLALAAIYQMVQWITALKAAANPAVFCYTITLLSSGVCYVIAVAAVDRLATLASVPAAARWPLTWSFAFGTVALTYARAVNDHVFLLAVFAALFVVLASSARRGWVDVPARTLIAIGTLTGVGYSIDLGIAPVLVVCVMGYMAWVLCPRSRVGVVVFAAVPWIALHHALTYMIGGTLKPLGAVSEYMIGWPGSPFTTENLTGLGWAHDSLAAFLAYAAGLLLGPKGFLVHNLVLFFVPAGVAIAWRAARGERALIALSIALIVGTWTIYAISSNNYSGEAATIRWFVPLLVPCYYILMLAIRHEASLRNEIAVVALWSIVLGVLIWRRGPWLSSIGPRLWAVNVAALITWIAYRLTHRRAA